MFDLTEKQSAYLKVLAYSLYALGMVVVIVAFSSDLKRIKEREGDS